MRQTSIDMRTGLFPRLGTYQRVREFNLSDAIPSFELAIDKNSRIRQTTINMRTGLFPRIGDISG